MDTQFAQNTQADLQWWTRNHTSLNGGWNSGSTWWARMTWWIAPPAATVKAVVFGSANKRRVSPPSYTSTKWSDGYPSSLKKCLAYSVALIDNIWLLYGRRHPTKERSSVAFLLSPALKKCRAKMHHFYTVTADELSVTLWRTVWAYTQPLATVNFGKMASNLFNLFFLLLPCP